MPYIWTLEHIDHPKFPYRVTICEEGREVLCLRAQEQWPGQKGNVFCMREASFADRAPGEVNEEIDVQSFNRYGKRVSVTLNRARKKRCDFLFLVKDYKNKPGQYEQIFWRTQSGMKERRPKAKLTSGHLDGDYTVIIDSNERYPWKFGETTTERSSLPVGDYGLLVEDELVSVVERKTFDNLIKEFSQMANFHLALNELSEYPRSVVVVEAPYADFLSPRRLKYYKPDFCAKAIAELQAYHPGLTIVFAGNRKLANEWTAHYFFAIASNLEQQQQTLF